MDLSTASTDLPTPAEFVPQGRVVTVAGNPCQLKRLLRLHNMNGVTCGERATDLAVNDKCHPLGDLVHGQRVPPVRTIDQRAIVQRVRVQWGDYKRLEVLSQNGAAGRKAVGS